MNKLHILCALGLGLAFASCDEVEDYIEKPQINPQETPFDASKVVVTPNTELINLVVLNAADQPAVLATATVDDPNGYSVRLAAQASKTEDFAQPVDLTTEAGADGAQTVSADELQACYYDHVTHDPREGKMYVRYAAYAVKDKTVARLGGPDFYYGPYELTVKPFDATYVIEDSYKMTLGNKEFTFNHSDASPYDDPNFSMTLEAVEGQEWQIVSATGTIYGPAGVTDMQGDLLADAPAGKFAISGPVMFTVNMYTQVYEYKQAYTCMYTPGGSNDWNAKASQQLSTTDYDYYSGLVVIDEAGFKMNPDDDWKGHDMGVGSALTETAPGVYEGTLDGGQNITAGAKGLYFVEFTLSTKSIKISAVNALGAIGGFNGWAESADMTPSADFLTWTSAALEFPENCEWKLRANNDWVMDWGGTIDNIVYKGSNIVTKDAGKYIITADFSAIPYTVTLTPQ